MLESVLQLYGTAMVILPVIAFVSLRKSVRNGGLSKRGALVRYAGMVVAPIAGYAVIVGLLFAAEAAFRLSLLSEEIARSFVLAIVLGVLVWVLAMAIFSLGLLFVRTSHGPDFRER